VSVPWLVAAAVALRVLRVWVAFTLRVNSDEPFLAAGTREFKPARDDEWALEWERAANAEYSPFTQAVYVR